MGILRYSYEVGQKLEVYLSGRREDAIFTITDRQFFRRVNHFLPHRYYAGVLETGRERKEIEISESKLKRAVRNRKRTDRGETRDYYWDR